MKEHEICQENVFSMAMIIGELDQENKRLKQQIVWWENRLAESVKIINNFQQDVIDLLNRKQELEYKVAHMDIRNEKE